MERKQVDVSQPVKGARRSQACQVTKKGSENDLTYRRFFPKYFAPALCLKEASCFPLLKGDLPDGSWRLLGLLGTAHSNDPEATNVTKCALRSQVGTECLEYITWAHNENETFH